MSASLARPATPSDAVQALIDRRSVSPRRLEMPGLSKAELEAALQAALRAPDHGSLTPWRVIEFADTNRAEVGRLFVDEKRQRDPLASADDLDRARAHALNAPTLLAFVVCIRAGVTVPSSEQWLAAGAALGNLLNAIHALGFGAIMLSGDRCGDARLARALGVRDHEKLAGFISAGTTGKAPPAAGQKSTADVLTLWSPADPEAIPSQTAGDLDPESC